MKIAELEALVADYQRRAEKFGARHGVRMLQVVLSCDGDGKWDVLFAGYGSLIECSVVAEKRAPKAALRAGYREYCMAVKPYRIAENVVGEDLIVCEDYEGGEEA